MNWFHNEIGTPRTACGSGRYSTPVDETMRADRLINDPLVRVALKPIPIRIWCGVRKSR